MTQGTLDQVGLEAHERARAAAPHWRRRRSEGAALLFASAAGKHITGQVLAIDGGVSAMLG